MCQKLTAKMIVNLTAVRGEGIISLRPFNCNDQIMIQTSIKIKNILCFFVNQY